MIQKMRHDTKNRTLTFWFDHIPHGHDAVSRICEVTGNSLKFDLDDDLFDLGKAQGRFTLSVDADDGTVVVLATGETMGKLLLCHQARTEVVQR